MEKTGWIGLFVVVIAASFSSPGWADKTTVDPNSQPVVVKTPEDEKPDPRLLQKTTYDSGYKRLHAVVEDISRMNGVDIRCGSTNKDWRVRDIPVVVCVKDMPLGKLLRAIADATHTWFASEKIGDDPKKSYRIYRRYKEEETIDSFFKRRREARLAAALWQWDAMAAYGKSDEIPELSEFESLWPFARLIASLGSGAKDDLFKGNTFRFSGRDPACKEIIGELYEHAWEREWKFGKIRNPNGESVNSAPLPTDEDIDSAGVCIKLVDTGDSGKTDIEWTLGPIRYGDSPSSLCSTIGDARELQDKGLDLPPYPKEVNTPSLKDDMANPDMALLSRLTAWATSWDADWDHPLLKAKIDIEKPKEIKNATFADLIRAIASASGCNIVVEDFVSHMASNYQQVDSAFKKDTNVRDSLRGMYFGGDCLSYSWFFNESERLLVGWPCDDNGTNVWRNLHRNMLSEEYLSGLKRKLDGDGVEFDDVIHPSNIPGDTGFDNSFGKWIWLSRDLQDLAQERVSGDTAVFWQLYDSLEPADKAAAKSESGLPLAKFDAAWIADFFKAQKLAEKAYFTGDRRTEAEEATVLEERTLRDRVLYDPNVISSMVMRVEKTPADRSHMIVYSNGSGIVRRGNNEALKLSDYSMVISYRIDGEDRKMVVKGPYMGCPIRSPEREAEIIKAATAKEKESK